MPLQGTRVAPRGTTEPAPTVPGAARRAPAAGLARVGAACTVTGGGGAPRGGTLREEVETGQEPPRWRRESCPGGEKVTRSERPGGSSLEHPGGLGLERSEVTVIPTAEAPQPRREPGPA